MKIITKAQLISQFGERNGTIMWLRHHQVIAGTAEMLAMMQEARERRGKARLKAYKEKIEYVKPGEHLGTFESRISRTEGQFLSGERKIGDKINLETMAAWTVPAPLYPDKV